MRRPLLTDWNSIASLASVITRWGEKLPVWRDLMERPNRVNIEAESYSAEASLELDRDREDGTLAIGVRLRQRGKGRRRGRYLLVSYGRSNKRLDYPRTWRLAAGRFLRERRKHRLLLDSFHLSREIYWTADIPRVDLEAQIVIALMQLGCIGPVLARERLAVYIASTFQMPLRGLPQEERKQAREAIGFLAASEVLNRWSFPEDCKAFRLYIKSSVQRASRAYGVSDELRSNTLDLALSPEYDDAVDEASRNSQGVNVLWMSPPISYKPELEKEMTVAAAAHYLSKSSTYLYRLIRAGRLRRIKARGPVRLLGEEVARFGRIIQERESRRERVRALESSGKGRIAARKSVYRASGSAPRI